MIKIFSENYPARITQSAVKVARNGESCRLLCMDEHTFPTHSRGRLSLKLLRVVADKSGREIASCDFVIYVTVLRHVFFYACSVHTAQAYATGGRAP